MKNLTKTIFLVSFLFNSSYIQSQSDSLVAAISSDSLMLTLKELTGALPITLGGKVKSIQQTRAILTTGNRQASEYFSQRMKRMGLNVEHSYFQSTYYKVQLNFTGINATPVTNFPLWLCSDWGEIFSMKDPNSEWESRLNSATPQIDRFDWVNPLNQNTIIAVGKTGNFALTTDAGESWTKKPTGIASILHFFASFSGTSIAVGEEGAIWRSTDLSSSWTKIIVDTNTTFRQGTFISNSHILLVGYDKLLTSQGRIFESKDAGVTWSVVQNTFSSQLKTVFSTDSLHAWCASSNGEVYYTSSGGVTWNNSVFEIGLSANKIFFCDNSNGWILTSKNKFFQSTDGGNNWNFLCSFDTTNTISDFLFYDLKNGLLIGKEVSKKQTSDGGIQWSDRTIPFHYNVIATINGTQRPEHYILFTAHTDCNRSTPADRWLLAPGADDDGSGIAVLLELARIFKKYPTPITLKFASVPDEELGGGGAANLGTVLLGKPYTCRLVLDFDMVGYDYRYPKSVAMTYSGGTVADNLFTKYVNIISALNFPLLPVGWKNATPPNAGGFRDKNIPILGLMEGAGMGSFMQPNYHKASDTWSTINPEYISNITRSTAAFIHNIATDLFVGISEEENSNLIPSSFILDLPYPNPFNSTTTLRFGLPNSAKASIIIYNLLGQQVAQVAQGYYEKGYHTISWEASNISSGIYFAQLTVMNDFSNKVFSKTCKLLLLK
ncbi:MAG: M20/M25/M40 family metallo-hydrolase [Melioribacter sp.]|nr:M20/M25/M40 family metallo-hydrolase [Melioribacter sp.]